jgi:hypothetical protein
MAVPVAKPVGSDWLVIFINSKKMDLIAYVDHRVDSGFTETDYMYTHR